MKQITSLLIAFFFATTVFAQCNLDLGQDTVYFCEGDCVPLDAGTGWTSIVWSTGETSQSICVDETTLCVAMAEDANGCIAQDSVTCIRLLHSVSTSSSIVCPGEEVALNANMTSDFVSAGVVIDTTYLPDGSGVNYETTVSVQSFGQGEVFGGAANGQYLEICAALEHSYLGDLEMMLTCPNGTNAVVFNSYTGTGIGPAFSGGFGGGGTFLGDPVDNTSGQIGIPWDYCFSDLAIWGTMGDEHPYNTTLTTINVGPSMSPGTYLPEESFESFAGCPMNGDWTITIRDNIGADDGYISFWGIGFSNEIGNVDYVWSNGSTESNIMVSPQSEFMWADMTVEGTTCRDSVQFDFYSLPEVNLGFDHADCNESNGEITNQTSPIDSIIIEVFTQAGIPVPSELLDPGLYSVTLTSPQGCSIDTTIEIITQIDSAEYITGATVVFPSQQFTYSVPYSACLNYSWSIDNGTIVSGQGTNEVQVTWNDSISGWISVDMNETRDFSQTLILYVGTATGITDIEQDGNALFLRGQSLMVAQNMNKAQLLVLNAAGQLVRSESVAGGQVIECSTLTAGFYTAIMQSENQRSVLKFAISR